MKGKKLEIYGIRIVSFRQGCSPQRLQSVDIGITIVACCTREEGREEIVDASRVLMRLKKRTWWSLITLLLAHQRCWNIVYLLLHLEKTFS